MKEKDTEMKISPNTKDKLIPYLIKVRNLNNDCTSRFDSKRFIIVTSDDHVTLTPLRRGVSSGLRN